MKKTIIFIFIILLSITLSSCKSNNVFTFILDESFDSYLVMATSADYPPYEQLVYENNKLTVAGIDIEIAKEIARANNKNLKVINKGFEFLLDDLTANKVDFVMSGLNPTPQRLEIVNFSNTYYETSSVIIVNKNNINKYNSISDLNNKNIRVATQIGSVQADLIDEYLFNSHKVLLKDFNALILQLQENQIDALLLEEPVAKEFIKKNNNLSLTNIYVGESESYAVALNKNNLELLASINNVINEITTSNRLKEIINNETLKEYENKKSFPFSFIFNKDYVNILLKGILMTIVLSLLAVMFGSMLGFLITLLRISENKFLKTLSTSYVELIRGTPLLVQVLLIYSLIKLPMILFIGIDLSSFIPGLLALLINSSAYTSEIFRGGIEAVDHGQKEAALALGLNDKIIMKKVILPQAIKTIIPSLGNEFISMIKETSIFMYLGIAELMYVAAIIQADTFQIKEVYIITALIYLAMTLTTSKLLSKYQKKLG